MIKFRVNMSFYTIEEIEVIRETDSIIAFKCEFMGEKKEKKQTNCSAWFDTRQEAKDFLIKTQERKIDVLKSQLDYAGQILEGLKRL